MSKINGEKARAAIAKRNRTAQRVKDRARLAEIRGKNDQADEPQAQPEKKS